MPRRYALVLMAVVMLGAARIALRAEEAPAAAVPAAAPAPAAAPVPAPRFLMPPAPPAHARRSLEAASELARDLSEVVGYLEAGQAYFRAYQKGSHSAEENRQFLAFLQTYENEYAVSKKEAAALKTWVLEQGSLDAVSK